MNAPRHRISASLLAVLIAIPAAAEEPDPTARELLAAHNKEREAAKLPPLTLDGRLTEAARLHARDMAEHGEMTHEGSDGSKAADRVKRAGYRFVRTGENVALGQRTAAEAVKAWMASEGHRENILGDFAQMGGAMVEAEDGDPYWCVEFASPRVRLDPDAAANEVAEKIAAIRKEAGKEPLEVDPAIAKAARALAVAAAADAAKPEAERKPPDLAAALKEAGVRYRDVEVLFGSGPPTAGDFVRSLAEDEKRKASLDGDRDAVGIGYATDAEDVPFWCVVLVER